MSLRNQFMGNTLSEVIVRPSGASGYCVAYDGTVTATGITDVFYLRGSASKIIRVYQIGLSGFASAAVPLGVNIVRRSTANSGGTNPSPEPAPVKLDSAISDATAVFKVYTANPTVGTSAGTLMSRRMPIGTSSTANSNQQYDFNLNAYGIGPIVLRGASEGLAVNLGGTTAAGLSLACFMMWTESDA